jgi:hypothetical protein
MKLMRMNRLWLVAASFAVVMTARPAAAAAPKGASDVESRTIELLPKGAARAAHPMRISVEAAVYARNGQGKEITRASTAPDEAFIASVIETYRSGTLEQALKLWAPEDREHKKAAMQASGGDIFKKNQETHKQIARVDLLCKVLYGDFILTAVSYRLQSGKVHIVNYPLVQRGDQYYVTDGLSDDPVFVYVMNEVVRKLSGVDGGSQP